MIVLSVWCNVNEASPHLVQEYADEIQEKYPFWCDEHDDLREGKYPWYLTARTEADDYELKGQL
jgi:hypothetical protein